MGYSHSWNQTRSFTVEEWAEASEHIRDILSYVENMLGVPLANGMAEGGTRPEFTANRISFNGVGDEDGHETFQIRRTRSKAEPYRDAGQDFCKTARKPYDVAATACLCYLSSVAGNFDVGSDGTGHDFLAGLDAARKALPAKANILDLPMAVMQYDRWTGPWVSHQDGSGYRVDFCIDGKGYVTQRSTGHTWGAPREVLARFLHENRRATFRTGGRTAWSDYGREETNIWNAYGSFDKARLARIARAQGKVLARLFPVPAENAEPPPAYVRPNDMPRPEQTGDFCYSLDDLLKKIAA